MKSKKAFTLIELLVVIAIIGLLMAIIVPALRKVKKQAGAIVCLSNMRSMAASWHAYSMDNDEKLVNGHLPRATTFPDGKDRHFWVEAPQNNVGAYTGDKALSGTILPRDEEQNGIRKGLLFPYIDAFDAYHCPSERSSSLFADKPIAPYGSWWNSYSITALMNGESSEETVKIYDKNATGGWDKNAALKMTQITAPGSKIVFLENGDWRGWLMGSWMMNYGTNPSWVDPFAIWHGDQSPLGFADGHAENHRWVDWSTNENAKFSPGVAEPSMAQYPTPLAGESGDDIRYMSQRYVPRIR